MISLLIDANDNRDVATADVAGAYLLAELKDFVLVKIDGTAVHIRCQVNPSFRSYESNEKGKRRLNLQLTNALYGYMQSALSWYKTFTECLEGMGFKRNPYMCSKYVCKR